MKIIIGCEFSGIIREAFEKLGHEVVSCDFIDTERPGNHYKGDIFDIIDFPYDLGIFHPPCTHTAVSGAKHFQDKKKDGRYYQGVSFFMKLWKRTQHIPKVCIEHPISIMSTLFRKPDQVIQPYMFGHGETKATCLFLRGLPKLKPTNIVEGRIGKVWKMPPGKDRWKDRSRTYTGIAQAMAEQWGVN